MEMEKETKIREELKKKDEIAMKKHRETLDEVINKSKAELEKVHRTIELNKERKTLELETMRKEIQTKLLKAEQQREQYLEQIKQTALDIGQRRSKSKELATDAKQ